MRAREFLAAVSAVLLLATSTAAGSERASISGTVVSAGGEEVVGATVSLPELRLDTKTDRTGHFAFVGIPEGEHLISVDDERFGGAVLRVRAAESGEIEIMLDKMVHSGAISVTALGTARGLAEVINPVDVLSGEDLQLRKQSSLGETLAQQPGVTSTSYGQGSSRPVIRGLGQDRIRVLENGLDTGDVSSIGPDHAVGMDPLAAEQVEVVRGPATVLWGANAIGGVVNVLDGRVPDRPAAQPIAGAVEVEIGSNSGKRAGAAKLDGGRGRFAWHADLYARDQDDYSSPAPRPVDEHEHGHGDEDEAGQDERGETGTVENSWTSAEGLTVGASFATERGYVGVAVGGYDTSYGIPAHHHHGDGEHGNKLIALADAAEEQPDAGVHSELEQRRIDLHSQLDSPFSGFSALRFSAGLRDYHHQEIEGDEVGTRFDNRWTEARFDLLNEEFLGFSGTLGMQYVNRSFAARGDEAFVEPTDTDKLGIYLFEQTSTEPVGFLFGLRFDHQLSTSVDPELPDRDFQTWTASAGIVWELSTAWSLTAGLNRPERAPTPEELYADGPHAATFSYEIGDPDLDPEIGTSVEVSVRAEGERFEATFSGFVTRYDRFIFLADTGVEIEGLEVMGFAQADADFRGFELHGHLELMHAASSHLHLGFSYDQVDAEFRATDEPVPRIPPRRWRLAMIFMADQWDARVEGWWVGEQTRTAVHETPTPGHELLNASVSYKIFSGSMVHQLLLRGRNLLDAEAYNHTSFIKYQAPLPGRDVSLVYRLLF